MQRYSEAMAAGVASGRHQWVHIKRWLEFFICGANPRYEKLIGRRDHPDGGKVTQAQFDAGDKAAHICPFVRDSIDGDFLWLEESDATDIGEIRELLLAQIVPFKKAAPQHDPTHEGPVKLPAGLKTFVTFFPQYEVSRPGPDEPVDSLHAEIKAIVRSEGMMIGQFYKTCRVSALYDKGWKNVLTAPYLVFALRYMQRHDKLFVEPGDPGYDVYCKLFGVPNVAHNA